MLDWLEACVFVVAVVVVVVVDVVSFFNVSGAG